MSKITEQEKIDEIKKFCAENNLIVFPKVQWRNINGTMTYLDDWGVGFTIMTKYESIVSVNGWNTVHWYSEYITLRDQRIHLGYVRKRLLAVVKALVEQYQSIEFYQNRIRLCRETIKNIFALNSDIVKE